jgi:hypothetical protein
MPIQLTFSEIASVASSSALWYILRVIWPLNSPLYLSNTVYNWPYFLNIDALSWITNVGVAALGYAVFNTGGWETLIGFSIGTGLNYALAGFGTLGPINAPKTTTGTAPQQKS